eukprot:COSAG02_NODE_1648_length_11502_cov_30.464439_7_plen_87_part_00
MPVERAATSMDTHQERSQPRQQPRMSKAMSKRFEKAEVRHQACSVALSQFQPPLLPLLGVVADLGDGIVDASAHDSPSRSRAVAPD